MLFRQTTFVHTIGTGLGVGDVRMGLGTTVAIVLVGGSAWLIIGAIGVEETLTPSMATMYWTSVVVGRLSFGITTLILGLVDVVVVVVDHDHLECVCWS